jgi:membrane protease YdiL (CAAX protease family)
MTGRRAGGLPLGPLVVGLTAWNNVVVPRLPARPGVYEAVNGTAAALLVAAARAGGHSAAELGLARDRLRAGAVWGGVPAAVLGLALAVAAAVPGTRPLLRDARVTGMPAGEVVYRALVRIPVGTVLWEEVAFRGALQAALARSAGPPAATAAGAAVFGAWHVHPTLAARRANAPGSRRVTAVLGGCASTAAAGALFTALRQRSGSLLAPALLHLAANVGGLLASAVAWRGRPEA